MRAGTRLSSRMARSWQEEADPVKDDNRLAWLWRLVEPQLRRRVESRAERRVREARLPVRKTFEAFNFAFQPKLDKDLVMELATLRFLAQGKNLLLAGMSGYLAIRPRSSGTFKCSGIVSRSTTSGCTSRSRASSTSKPARWTCCRRSSMDVPSP